MSSSFGLRELARAIGADCGADAHVTGITADSRLVEPGYLYVAMAGAKEDGARYIAEAVSRGAVAVVTEHGARSADGAQMIRVDNPRLALSQAAAAFYPRQPECMVAVTGTDGKTSTAEFFRQLAEKCGHKAASLGTLGVTGANGAILSEGTHTTPGPVELHAMLTRLHDEGYTHAALEASSHGLHQHRLDGVRLKAAASTVITRDHLDYHATLEAYLAAKARLFAELLPEDGIAVLNADDAHFAELQHITMQRNLRLLTYGRAGAELRIDSITPIPAGQEVRCTVFGTPRRFTTKLVGAFQVHNMLAALGLITACGEEAAELLPQLSAVPGRMERVALHNDAALYIDYAHTPAALETALRSLRPHTAGRLMVVFGCGGDRDKGKRPQMGEVAEALADVVIVTDDNPRSEDQAAIRAEVLSGAPRAKAVAPREEAIYAAARLLAPGDVLLVAGKGHEKTQIIGGVSHAFDDAEIIRKAIHAL